MQFLPHAPDAAAEPHGALGSCHAAALPLATNHHSLRLVIAPLGYSTNLHAAESLAELEQRLLPFAAGVRTALGWQHLGIDLRLGDQALADLTVPGAVNRLRAACDRLGLAAHTLNGFPLRAFQASRVKEQAYFPDWSEEARLTSSLRLLTVAFALSDDALVTISTVPGAYRPAGPQHNEVAAIARNLARWVVAAHQAWEKTGRVAVLCLEPEPWCLLETSHDVAWFWHGPLQQHGLPVLRQALGSAAEDALARHLGICVDTCHLSLAFEDQTAAVARMAAAGARIAKCQFSAAPEVRLPDKAGLAALQALAEPRFLHQSAALSAAGSQARVVDLDQLDLLLKRLPEAVLVRSHFHIPVFRLTQSSGLSSTILDSERGLAACLAHGCTHVAVETYTWSILAPDARDVQAGTIRELQHLQACCANLGHSPSSL